MKTDTTAARVDVLAVMDGVAAWAQQVADRGGIPQRVREAASGTAYQQGLARAAVAELIADVEAFASDYAHGLGPDVKRLRAALARVQP